MTTRPADFTDRLSADERVVYAAFKRAQEKPRNTALFLFKGYFDEIHSLTSTFSGAALADFIDTAQKKNPGHYRHFLMALNLQRSFESQWKIRPGFFDETEDFFDAFIGEPLIAVAGLPDSPHNNLTLAHNVKEPAQRPATARTPSLKLLQGGLAP